MQLYNASLSYSAVVVWQMYCPLGVYTSTAIVSWMYGGKVLVDTTSQHSSQAFKKGWGFSTGKCIKYTDEG